MLTRKQIASLLAEIDKQESTLARQKAFLLGEDERLAAEERTKEVLQKSPRSSTLDRNMEDAHRIAISRNSGRQKDDERFAAATRKAGYTQNSLAAKVPMDSALLSKYRRKLRKIPQDRAERIADLIDWPADSKHWPCGIIPKD